MLHIKECHHTTQLQSKVARIMMNSQSTLLCLILVLVLCCVLLGTGVQGDSGCPVLLQPPGTDTTGCFFVVLKDETSDLEMEELMQTVLEMSEDSKIHSAVKMVSKAFTVKLSNESLEMVCCIEWFG